MIMDPRWNSQSILSPVERNPYLAICARMGLRLGRVKGWALSESTAGDAGDFALRCHTACAAFGLSLLAGRLELTEETRRAISRLVEQVDEYFALDNDLRAEQTNAFLELSNGLYFDLRIEIEVNHGDECMRAFDFTFYLLQIQGSFRASAGGSPERSSSLRKFLYSADIHPFVADGLTSLESFCESQAQPLRITEQVRRFAAGFRNRSLSAPQIKQLRSLLLGPWPEEVENYFSPIHGVDVGNFDPDLLIDELAVTCFGIGEICGAFDLRMCPGDVDRARKNLKWLRSMLARVHLPVNPNAARLNVPVLDEGKPSPPPGVPGRAEYRYLVTGPLKEAVECLYGGVLTTLVELALSTGAVVELISSETDLANEDPGELLLDPHFRAVLSESLDALVAALDLRWISPDLLKRVHRDIGLWRRRDEYPEQSVVLRDFLTGEFRNAVVREAVATLSAAGGPQAPPQLEPPPTLR
jgi:hypothetical protein